MKTYQQIIDDMQNVSSDMAKIIGRYKGSMSVYAEEIKYLAENFADSDLRSRLEFLVGRMENVIAENEKAFDDRGKREVEEAA